jgi:hypothetical protein
LFLLIFIVWKERVLKNSGVSYLFLLII